MTKANPITRQSRLARNDTVPTGDIDGEMMALDPVRGEVFGFDAIATQIWSRIDPDRDVGELIDGLVEDFDVSPQRCEREVFALLDELIEVGLVRPATP